MPPSTTQGRGLNIFVALFFSFTTLFSLWALASSVNDFANASASSAWPVTDGVVVSSQIQRGCKNLASYLPDVRYRYSVRQQEYQGRRIQFGDNLCRSKSDAERIVSAYSEGKSIQVHFDPASPNNPALNVSSTEAGTWSVLIVALIIFSGSFPTAYYYIKLCLTSSQKRQQRPGSNQD